MALSTPPSQNYESDKPENKVRQPEKVRVAYHAKTNGYYPNKQEDLNEKDDMTPKESLIWGIIGGLLAAITGAFIWAEFTIIVEKDWAYDPQHAYMSMLIGLIVGLSVRFLGKGRDIKFGLTAVALAIIGCMLGNIFSSVAYVVATLDLSYFTVITIFDHSQLIGFISDRFAYWDILFYSLTLVFAYFFSVRGAIRDFAETVENAFRSLINA